jgi:hypothetical protein
LFVLCIFRNFISHEVEKIGSLFSESVGFLEEVFLELVKGSNSGGLGFIDSSVKLGRVIET